MDYENSGTCVMQRGGFYLGDMSTSTDFSPYEFM